MVRADFASKQLLNKTMTFLQITSKTDVELIHQLNQKSISHFFH